jgi:hypothetical protein
VNPDPTMFEAVLFSTVTTASVAAFLACIVLFRYTKFPSDVNRLGNLRCLYQYGALFFGGLSVMCVNWLMGARAPVPIRPLLDDQDRVGFAALVVAWLIIVSSAFIIHRAFRVALAPKATNEGRQLLRARVAQRDGRLVEGRMVDSAGIA